jgi:hypothetical protein
LAAGWNTTLLVAFDAYALLKKMVSDKFIPQAPDVDGWEINRLLKKS